MRVSAQCSNALLIRENFYGLFSSRFVSIILGIRTVPLSLARKPLKLSLRRRRWCSSRKNIARVSPRWNIATSALERRGYVEYLQRCPVIFYRLKRRSQLPTVTNCFISRSSEAVIYLISWRTTKYLNFPLSLSRHSIVNPYSDTFNFSTFAEQAFCRHRSRQLPFKTTSFNKR